MFVVSKQYYSLCLLLSSVSSLRCLLKAHLRGVFPGDGIVVSTQNRWPVEISLHVCNLSSPTTSVDEDEYDEHSLVMVTFTPCILPRSCHSARILYFINVFKLEQTGINFMLHRNRKQHKTEIL